MVDPSRAGSLTAAVIDEKIVMTVLDSLPLLSSHKLQQIALFKDLSSTELESICHTSRTCRVKSGDFFFHQDDPADTLYILVQGRIKMMQISAEGQQVLVRIVTPCEDFGTVAVLSEMTYPLSAQAAEDCLAIAWDKELIIRLLSAHPRLVFNALRLVSQRFRELQDRYRELATERVERRVARALLRLEHQVGRRVDQGILIDLTLSRQDLAQMTGTTLYTVSRILSQWEQQGLVETGREKVVLINLPGLLVIAEDLPDNASTPSLI